MVRTSAAGEQVNAAAAAVAAVASRWCFHDFSLSVTESRWFPSTDKGTKKEGEAKFEAITDGKVRVSRLQTEDSLCILQPVAPCPGAGALINVIMHATVLNSASFTSESTRMKMHRIEFHQPRVAKGPD